MLTAAIAATVTFAAGAARAAPAPGGGCVPGHPTGEVAFFSDPQAIPATDGIRWQGPGEYARTKLPPTVPDGHSDTQWVPLPQAGPGVQLAPIPCAAGSPSGQGGAVSGGGESHPAFWDIPGQIKKAIDDWFRHLVTDALNPALELVGKTLLSTPQVVSAGRVGELWAYSLGIADALLVLLIVIAGGLVMGHETVQSRYALKDALPRLAFAAIVANASLALSGQLIAIADAFSFGFLSGGVDPAQASASLKQFIVGAVASGGIFLIFLGLACAVVAVILLVLYIVRAALIVVLVCAAPLMLIAHALPQTEGLARLWWRGMTAALGVQVAQAFLLATALRVFFTSEGHSALGLSVTGSLIDLLVALCLLWLLVKVPFWAKELAFSHRPSLAVRAAKTYVLAQVGRTAV
jgi:hypothetical protein